MFAHLVCVLHKVLFLHDVEHSESRRASHVVAAKRGAELAVDGLDVRRNEHGTHGEAVADALCHGYDVGTDAEPLVCEELTATAISALYLIANEECAVALAGCLKTLCKLGGGHAYAAHALYALKNHGCHVALVELLLPRLKVVEGQVGNMSAVVDGRYDLRVVCHLHRQRCATVERLLCRQHARAAGLERGELQRVLVGLGTRVDEEQLIVVVAARLA